MQVLKITLIQKASETSCSGTNEFNFTQFFRVSYLSLGAIGYFVESVRSAKNYQFKDSYCYFTYTMRFIFTTCHHRQ